jgi:hypothetical protein
LSRVSVDSKLDFLVVFRRSFGTSTGVLLPAGTLPSLSRAQLHLTLTIPSSKIPIST